tara:strand:- start:2062 stop:2907 length:846 start_codon:yes stop_codon:yes gene_type:complete
MEFKKDFKIKPKEVNLNGIVTFTDGTNDVLPNELACEAYGYKYDKITGACISFIPTTKLDEQLKEPSNKITGATNKNEKGTQRTIINGTLNTAKGFNKNCLISGEKNEVQNNTNNGLLIGKMGKITHDSEFCVGGGGFNSEAGLLQYSVLQVSGKTTSTSDVDLYIEGDDARANEILLPANSVTTYEIWLSGLVTGGSSGTPGNYETYEYHGTIRCANNGTLTHNAKISRLLGRTGSLGTQTIDTSTAYTLKIQIAGQNNVNCQWHAVVKLHINKTNAVTF